MKRIKILLSALFCLLVFVAAFAQDKAQTPASVKFADEEYFLVYSVQSANGQWLNEYLRKNDNNLNNYSKLIAVRYYEGSGLSPDQIALNMASNLEKKHKTKADLSKNSKTGAVTMTFMLASGEVTEINYFKLAQYKGHTISLQFVRRYNTAESFKKDYEQLSQDLDKWNAALAATPIPVPIKTIKK